MREKGSPGRAGIAVLAGIAILVAAVLLWRSNRDGSADTLARAREQGLVRVAIANEAPYGYLDTDSGRVTGEAPEIAREILSRLGIETIDVVNTDFGSLIPGLKAGRFDLIAAGMYVTPERCREIDFSRPTYRIGEAFLVRAGNPLGLRSFEDVAAHPTARLGVVAGTVEVAHAERAGVPGERTLLFNGNIAALEGVRTGQVDAFAGTALTIEDLLAKAADPSLERAGDFVQPRVDGEPVWGYGAFGFRRGDEAFRQAFDDELDAFLGSEEHRALVGPFGFTEEELPGDVGAAELCEPGG